MFAEINNISQEIENIILENSNNKKIIKDKLQRLKTLLPQQQGIYNPSGKTNLVSVIFMGLSMIPATIVYLLVTFAVLLIFNAVFNILGYLVSFLGIDKFFLLLLLLFVVPLKFLYPYELVASRISKFIAFIAKTTNNRNYAIAGYIAVFPSALLMVTSVILQLFLQLDTIDFDLSKHLIARTGLIFITITSLRTVLLTFKLVKKEIYQQKFDEIKYKYYTPYKSRKFTSNIAPYLKYLVVNQAYDDGELKNIIQSAFEGYKSFVLVTVYKFAPGENYDQGYVEMEVTFSFKQNLINRQETWLFYSKKVEQAELEILMSYLQMG